MNQLVSFTDLTPALIAAVGERASYRFFEFFTANIRNPNTRRAYARAAVEFFDWLEARGVTHSRRSKACMSPPISSSFPRRVPRRPRSCAWRRCGICSIGSSSARSCRPIPRAPCAGRVISCGAARRQCSIPQKRGSCIDAIDTKTVIGLRDRALIGLMVYSFARIGAAIGMRVEDVYSQNRRLWVRLHEKGGKQHAMPCHHNLEAYLHAYIDGAGLASEPKALLFQTYSRATGQLTGNPLPQANAYAMIQRRAKSAGITTRVGNHTFRATGVTAYLKNGGTLERAAQMANHASTRTTQLYDRRAEEVTLDEVERVLI